jgi:hypothetical protein
VSFIESNHSELLAQAESGRSCKDSAEEGGSESQGESQKGREER